MTKFFPVFCKKCQKITAHKRVDEVFIECKKCASLIYSPEVK